MLALAIAAQAAEVDAAEVDGQANLVTVEQGQTVHFLLSVRATGMVRCAATTDDPATATFPELFDFDENGGLSTSGATTAKFVAGTEGGGSCQVTWDGDPNSMLLPVAVKTHAKTPTGVYSYLLRASTYTPPGPGDRLEDRSRTILRFEVVPGSDTTPPAIGCSGPIGTLGDNGWFVSTVTHECTAADDGSGLADPSDAAFTLRTSDEGAVFTTHRAVVDNAGNAATAGPFGPYRVDLEDPGAVVHVPAPNASYLLGSSVASDFACWDSTSGVASCEGDAALLDTSSVGEKKFKVHTKDRAGRTQAVTLGYRVVYDFGELALSGGRHPRAGQAIPVSWTLNGVSDPSTFVALDSIPCEGGANEGGTPGRSDVSYSKGNDRFHAVWKTDGDWSGSCRTLQVHLSDGTVHPLQVSFR